MNPDRLAELEEERRFLLGSLRDLDAELGAGDVGPDDYEALRDGYTKRAADVLREIDEGRTVPTPSSAGRWRRRLVTAAVVVAVALVAGWLVARSSGQRLDGQEITGGAPSDELTVALAEARQLLLAGDIVAAQARYEDVLDRQPDQVEAVTYSAWLLFNGSQGASGELRSVAVDTARQQLDRAIAIDGTYADPHCFLAVIAADVDAGDDRAVAEERAATCRCLDPPAQLRQLVDRFVPEPAGPPTSC